MKTGMDSTQFVPAETVAKEVVEGLEIAESPVVVTETLPVLTDSDEFPTNLSVGIVSSEKKIRRNFVRTSDDFLTNTEKRHSDELPTILRCGHTRPEFIEKTTYRRRAFFGQFRRSVFLGVFRRTLGVGIYRRTMVVGIYRRTMFVDENMIDLDNDDLLGDELVGETPDLVDAEKIEAISQLSPANAVSKKAASTNKQMERAKTATYIQEEALASGSGVYVPKGLLKRKPPRSPDIKGASASKKLQGLGGRASPKKKTTLGDGSDHPLSQVYCSMET
ncbi:hypothetical protein DY000_02012083 [Brassica cretica]|uniref:Uncharacterized protein n=1 Tax=Brassica cretica TaxID=69181 RepID=A0ABQ7D6E5_BRACR|nr:hypothetical protein DY000_02012083 [Brassica cretica]